MHDPAQVHHDGLLTLIESHDKLKKHLTKLMDLTSPNQKTLIEDAVSRTNLRLPETLSDRYVYERVCVHLRLSVLYAERELRNGNGPCRIPQRDREGRVSESPRRGSKSGSRSKSAQSLDVWCMYLFAHSSTLSYENSKYLPEALSVPISPPTCYIRIPCLQICRL